jgi:hypothetical protein
MKQILCNKKVWGFWQFKNGLGPEKLVRKICSVALAAGLPVPLLSARPSLLSSAAAIICLQSLWLPDLANGRHDFS